eukprot:GHVN01011877.1.p1 GENE.GHVN01011877.1~~GHVN01011877.1.p1  ORF type:complete len:107 (-),score=3.72 GHVN01011877.1:33-320(-)
MGRETLLAQASLQHTNGEKTVPCYVFRSRQGGNIHDPTVVPHQLALIAVQLPPNFFQSWLGEFRSLQNRVEAMETAKAALLSRPEDFLHLFCHTG